jgi:hypothetical protein
VQILSVPAEKPFLLALLKLRHPTCPAQSSPYLNPKTGEIVTVPEEDRHLVGHEDLDEQDLTR